MEQLPSWLSFVRRVPKPILVFAGLIVLVLIIAYSIASGTSLWDWLKLLIVPAAIAFVGYGFNWAVNRNAQMIARRHAQDEALQAYLDHMGDLLLKDDLRTSVQDSDVRKLAWAYTLTVLRRVGPDHKRSVLDFLYGANLIFRYEPIIPLGGSDFLRGAADLSGAYLIGAHLNEVALDGKVNMKSVDLRGASLISSNLSRSILTGADLSGADLSGADLVQVNLHDARLAGTKLTGASLQSADLSEVKFQRAEGSAKEVTHELRAEGFDKDLIDRVISDPTDLRGADLRWTEGLTQEQIEQAIGDRTTRLPDHLRFPETWNTDLTDLSRTNLMNADLSGANLAGVNLSGANLFGAYLHGANLSEAVVEGANLSSANLSEAHLNGANLSGAMLSEAYLYGADLRRADFQWAKGLTQEQIEWAIGDATTKLPEDLTCPASWDNTNKQMDGFNSHETSA